jgi:hypothetical protein
MPNGDAWGERDDLLKAVKKLRGALRRIASTSKYKAERIDYADDVIKEMHKIAREALDEKPIYWWNFERDD